MFLCVFFCFYEEFSYQLDLVDYFCSMVIYEMYLNSNRLTVMQMKNVCVGKSGIHFLKCTLVTFTYRNNNVNAKEKVVYEKT